MKIRDDGQTHMSAINLEGCTGTELKQVAAHPAVHNDVRRMAELYISSRAARLAGNIELALRLEASAERYYATLPEWARW